MYTKLASIFDKSVSKTWNKLDLVERFIGENKKLKLVLFITSLLFFGSIIFVFNRETPLQWDDFKLAFIWTEEVYLDENGKMNEPTERVTSFVDIVQSQYNHYFTWGGRTIVHVIAQFLLLINPLLADILNTLVYLIYTILIYYHIVGKSKHSLITFIVINFLIWFLQPVFGETILWITGSANYLWGTTIVLLFLLPFRLFDNTSPNKNSFVKGILILLVGITAGWTNENTAGAAIFMTILFLIYYRSQKWEIPSWAVCGLIGMLIGYLIMILAPGNVNRAELRTSGMSLSLFLFTYRFLTTTQNLVQYLGLLNLFSLILFLLIKRYTQNNEQFKRIKFLAVVYLLGTIAGSYAMLLSPIFPPRAWFGVITFNIISFGVLFHHLNCSFNFIRQIRMGILILGILTFGFTLYDGYRDVHNVNNIWKQREIAIKRQQTTGEKAVINWTYGRTKFSLSDPPFLPSVISLYYGVDVEVK